MSMSQVSMSSFIMPEIAAVLGDEAHLQLGFWEGPEGWQRSRVNSKFKTHALPSARV